MIVYSNFVLATSFDGRTRALKAVTAARALVDRRGAAVYGGGRHDTT
jgi:hypothetical protein